MVGQLLLGLSILVGVHEWGHMVAAKAFGMRVEKFSIGFPPKIWGKQIGETEYSIGAIPLGGFVKITGMIDESLDTKSMSAEPEPYEFRAKPAWQRLIVMMGGIIVNVVTGIIIFIGLALANGEAYLPQEKLNEHGIVAYDLGEQLGFKTGDKVLAINGQSYERFSDLLSPDLLLGSDNYYTVLRDGNEVRVEMPNDFIDKFADKNNRINVITPRWKYSVGKVIAGSNADKAGLEAGDRILSVNGVETIYFDQLSKALDSFKTEQVTLKIEREGKIVEKNADVDSDGTIGFQPKDELDYVIRDFSFGEALSEGTYNAFAVVWLNIKGFKKMFAGDVDVRKSLSGPIKIATFFGGTWDWNNFWRIVGLLSMVLAFMNFLPIPALDGGHVVFLTWEIVTGRKPSDRFLENAQKVGMVILLSLMAFVIINDTISLF
ncbi:site-2 protease. Metallo peptidase. MEROPS family M50B [Ekhidna lutea]|uniref:Zinc metalloprotease n=2 Tax=Ekhidna lutea TaxID=447679 RepID=A0A239KBE7_EKHLU|nr:site-2 protease. Metallo peptidase. MEROPS family M50B [Ekhidna lutea]